MIILVVGLLLIVYCLVTKKFSVWVGMLFVLLILGFQENIPGDYYNFKSLFEFGDPGKEYGGQARKYEFLYIWLTMTMSKFMNFHTFVFLTSLLQCFVMALMIKTYANKRYQYFGLLLIFFTQNILLMQMKAMQQGYAVDLLFLGFYLLGKHKYLLSIIPVIFAYGCHNSSSIVFPFFLVLWGIMYLQRKRKNDKMEQYVIQTHGKAIRFAMTCTICLWIFYILKFTIFDSYINPFLNELEFFEYSSYTEEMKTDTNIAFWIMLYYTICTFAIALYYEYEHNLFKKYLAIISLICVFLTVGILGYSNLMRVNMYFIIFSVVVYPNVTAVLRKNYGKNMAQSFVIVNILFVMFFSVRTMLSTDYANGTGFAPFMFSFFNW